jgi:uncharacterized integral membrane protein
MKGQRAAITVLITIFIFIFLQINVTTCDTSYLFTNKIQIVMN